jgi:hypothetical protein
MFTNMKIALAAAIVVGAASTAIANDVETNPSSAQSAREWSETQGQKHRHEVSFASNTYDSPDWAPIYSGSTIRREPTAGASERTSGEFYRAPNASLSHKMEHHQR